MRTLLLIALATPLSACQAPPPAPEGLDEATRYLVREFYGSDAAVGAGLTGLLDWVDGEGQELLGRQANLDSVGQFELERLAAEDIDGLPVGEIGHDLDRAEGVVALSEVSCSWERAEQLLLRPDQDAVFEGEWAHYEREFLGARDAFEQAREGRDFTAIGASLTPHAEGFEPSDFERSLLLTSNPLGTSEVGVELDYTLNLHFRHGVFDVQGEPTPATLVLTWLPERGGDGSSSLEQSWSVDVYLHRGDERTLRLVAVWNEVISILGDDTTIIKSSSINRMLRFAERLSGICQGQVTLPQEGA